MKTRRWPAVALALGVVWVFVNGPAITPRTVLTTLLVGTTVGTGVAYLFRRFYGERVDVPGVLAAVPYAVLYVLVFLKEVVVANLDVAYRVLAVRMPIEPQVILVPLRVETDLGVTTIANSITNTPGTITLDHDPEENALYVHIINGRDPEAVAEPIRQWEDYALRIFDEEQSPGDPPRDIRIHPPDYPPEPQPARGVRTPEDEETTSGGEDNDR